MKKNTLLKFFLLFSFLCLINYSGGATTLYWVGGSGEWHNTSHWSVTSGGNGGVKVPAATDDVIFDQNSFNSPNEHIIFSGRTECNSMTWTSDVKNPTVSNGLNSSLDIYGSLILSQQLAWNYTGEINFKSAQNGNIINANGKLLPGNITINGSGTWQMAGALILSPSATLTFSSGSLSTNGNAIQCGILKVDGTNYKMFDFNTSVLAIKQEYTDASAGNFHYNSSHAKIYLQNALPVSSFNTIHSHNTPHSPNFAPSVISVDSIIINPTCNGADTGNSCNGAIIIRKIFATDGGPFSISWAGPKPGLDTVTADSVFNLCPNTYSFTIIDSNDLTVYGPIFVTITAPPPLTVNYTKREVKCNGFCDGWIITRISGETPNYTYRWSNGISGTAIGSPSNSFIDSALCAGTYAIRIKDSHGCVNTFKTNIIQPPPVTISFAPTNISCNGSCNGAITATVSGGHGTYTYSWTPGGQTTATITGLCPGTYSLTAKDDSGCVGMGNVTITQPTVLAVSVSKSNVTCNGNCNGSATATASGGTPAYTYKWSNGATTSSISSLCAGVFKIVVTDSHGCKDSANVTITQPLTITLAIAQTNVSCNGNCDGKAAVTVSGGTPAYTYKWSNGATTSSISPLCPGVYKIVVKDANGCKDSVNVTITQPLMLAIAIAQTNPTCNGNCNGTATATVTGGTPVYTYKWSNGATTSSISSLCAGAYKIVVTDKNGCKDSANVTITQPAGMIITTTNTNVNCSGSCIGTATVSVSGGNSPYTFKWSTGATTTNISNLCAGVYKIVVTDNKGCKDSANVTITQPNPITISISQTNVKCKGDCNGTATATASGGAIPYTYKWSNGATTSSTSGLCAGVYKIVVTDKNGCKDSVNVNITQPATGITISTVQTNLTCNGSCNGAATANVSGGIPAYTYTWSNGATTSSISSLCAGIYKLVVKDSNGCKDSVNVTITQPAPLVLITSQTNVTCFGDCNGTASVTVSGGSPAYTYKWNTGATTTNVSGLCPGTSRIVVTDANGCKDSLDVNITQPLALNITTTQTNINCTGNCNGIATATVTGGSPAYTYKWSNGATTTSISSLCAGVYKFVVTDSHGCKDSVNVTITQPANAITINIAQTNLTCNGSCDGSIIATVSGGTPAYTYKWSNGATTSSLSSLCAGAFKLVVTDKNGCKDSVNVTVTQPSAISISTTQTNEKCNGDCNGIASATASGGTPAYTYKWNTGATTTSISNLCAGAYTLVVTDSHGCKDSVIVNISQPNLLIAPISTLKDVSCNGLNDGVLTVTPLGGTAPYTYLWTPPGNTTASITGLSAGNYTIAVTDSNGCSVSESVVISQPPVLTASASSTPTACNNTGTATVSAGGGTAPYTYYWNPSAETTATATGLSAGVYTVSVTDYNGCNVTDTITVKSTTTLSIIVSNTDLLCNGASTGTATVSASGGVSPYTYLWNPGGGTTPNISNLSAGTYTIIVTDNVGCTQSATVTITQPPVISLTTSSTGAGCSNNSGTATVNASGGTGAYTYSWNPGAGTTSTITGLGSGSYTITVTDANGCSMTALSNVANGGVGGSITSINNIACFGDSSGSATVTITSGKSPFTYLWSPGGQTTATATGLSAGSYIITVFDSNGCSFSAGVIIIQPASVLAQSHAVTNASCNSTNDGSIILTVSGGTPQYTFSWSNGSTTQNQSNILSGIYTVTIKDSAGCSITDTIIVPSNKTVIAKAGRDTSVCANTSITFNGDSSINAVSYKWLQMPTLNVISDSVLITVSPTVTTTYILVALNGGCSDSSSVTITIIPPITVDAGPTQYIVPNQSATIGGSPTGPNGSTYLWEPGFGLSDSTIANPVASPSLTTTYTVFVDNPNGCPGSDTVTVFVVPHVVIPDGFSPNGDGQNDVWNIGFINNFPGVVVEVYNRWGELLFRSMGYKTPWDGTYNGKPVPIGTYYYVINLHDPRFTQTYTGPVTILR